jgi:hypothetical protein
MDATQGNEEMTHRYTHTAEILGCDARTNPNFRRRVYLRETKLHWVSKDGLKFRKTNGIGIGDWPLYMIDMDTIKPLVEEKK